MVDLKSSDYPVDTKAQAPIAELSAIGMPSETQRHNQFLDTSSAEALAAWNELLKLQVKFFSPGELHFLAGIPPWQQARSVLDVGCGNGLFTAALRKRFPEKTYAGVDIAPGLIAEAQSNDPAIAFETADFFTYLAPRRFDIVVMRFLVQHLTDFGAVLRQCHNLLTPGGGLIVIEPDLPSSRNVPSTPTFEALLAAFEQRRVEDGRMRGQVAAPATLIAREKDWRLAFHRRIWIVHRGAAARDIASQLYMEWLNAIERSDLMRLRYDTARDELLAWVAQPRISTEVSLHAILLQRGR